jgi:hypothetical protein
MRADDDGIASLLILIELSEFSSLTKLCIAFVTESAAMSRSLRNIRTFIVDPGDDELLELSVLVDPIKSFKKQKQNKK